MAKTFVISIHAPARGATLSFQATGVNPVYFNPRSREGSDRKSRRSRPITAISIHAPARGATRSYPIPSVRFAFQSTLPRGERRRRLWKMRCRSINFNPRSREGSDAQGAGHRRNVFISIHAPARGATLFFQLLETVHFISIHAPARGATIPKSTLNDLCNDFNPRSREGSDM